MTVNLNLENKLICEKITFLVNKKKNSLKTVVHVSVFPKH